MQSLHVARLLLNAAAFALALLASTQSAWSVVEPAAASPPSRALANHPERPERPETAFVRLRFAPGGYCLDARNGSSDCHAYAFLLTQQAADAAPTGNLSLDASTLLAATPSNRLQAAVSAWCIASTAAAPSESGGGGAWLLQGAQSMLCLVVLETCVYSSLLWLLMGASSVVFAAATIARWRGVEGAAALTTVAQASLALLVLVEWCGFALYMMDAGYVAVLQLVVHFGVSCRAAALSLLASALACRVSTKLSSPRSSWRLARLDALPLSPRARRRRALDDAEIDDEDATRDCLEQAADPLTCPANYRV